MHSDIVSPMTCHSLLGGKYFVIFVDYFTRFKWTYVLIVKSDMHDAFKISLSKAQFLTGAKLKCFTQTAEQNT